MNNTHEQALTPWQQRVYDQAAASLDAGRMGHALLFSGPAMLGKRRVAERLAARLLCQAPDHGARPCGGCRGCSLFQARSQKEPLEQRPDGSLSHPWGHPAHPDAIFVGHAWRITPSPPRQMTVIPVDQVRALSERLATTPQYGAVKVAIIDPADDMNTNAANALLKLLEEPPRDALLLLVAHRPARLLPTIRSRCRELRLTPLSPGDMARALAPLEVPGDAARLAALSGGSVGEALRLAGQDGLDRYAQLVALFSRHPDMDRHATAAFAQGAAGRPGAEGDPFDLTMTLIELFLARAARSGLLGPPLPEAAPQESATFARMSPDDRAARHWAGALAELSARARAGRAVNLDPAALVMDMLLTLAQGRADTPGRG